jgi:hypothetical protein
MVPTLRTMDVLMIRYLGEDQQGLGKGQGVEDEQQGRPQQCNALNLGVEFFSSFLSPNSGVTLFSLSPFAASSQFQTSIAAGVRVMYKTKPKSHRCCIMPKHISLSDVECSSRSVPDFGSRFNSV